jgi:excisionase family DNA binding protein
MSNQQKTLSDLLRYEQAAEEFNIPINTLYSKVSRREIPHYRLGGRCVRFSRKILMEWIDGQRISHEIIKN